MPDKDFEQQVREGLQDWQMVPPPSVRQAVLDAVRQRKRRRALVWIPLAALLLGFFAWGGWYVFRRSPVDGAALSSAGAAAPTRAGGTVPVVAGGRIEPVTSAPPVTGEASRSGTIAPGATAHGIIAPGAPAHGTIVPGAPAHGTIAPGAPTQETIAPAIHPEGSDSGAPEAMAADERIVSLPGEEWIAAATASVLLPPVVAVHPQETADNAKVGKTTAGKGAAPAKTASGKWSFRVYGSAGFSGQGSFLQFRAPAENVHAHFAQSLTSAGTGPGNLGGNTGSASGLDTLAARRAGGGWTLGVSESLRLSRHFRVGAGLEYARFDTRIGELQGASPLNYTASSPAGVYSGNGTGATIGFTYTNRYQFLSLPLDLTWTIAPGRRWNPSLYAGISPAYLFSGDALMYNPGASGYEKNTGLYRHWSLYGEAGFTADLFRVGPAVISGGPLVQYGFSGIQKPAPVKDHLNYAGIRLGIALPSKVNKHKP